MKVTRVAYSKAVNAGKYAALTEQARRLGAVRSPVWQRYGSIAGVGVDHRAVRDRWADDPYLSRIMRKHWKRGKNRTWNQIVVRADQYTTWTLTDGGDAPADPG